MKQGLVYRSFVYFLCVSLLLLMGGFPRLVVEAKEVSRPIGEMVSRGEVKYETGENTWKKVETTHFPLFQGVKIKTEKGSSILALANNSQVELSQNSILSLEEPDRLQLSQGSIDFRIPATAETSIKVASLSIMRARPLQAARNPNVAPSTGEGVIGSIMIHSSGSVTVKSDQGTLTVLDQDRNVLAALSSKESVTIPSPVASGKEKVMVAQAPGTTEATAAGGGAIMGLSTWALIGVGVMAAGVGGMAVSAGTANYFDTRAAVCP